MIHYYDTDIAQEYSIEEAVVIQNFAYWISKNAANNTHLYDGRYWTYTTIAGISSLFPEIKNARYIVDKLVGNGILLKGNYNKTTMDRTCWYAFTDKGLELISRYNISTQCICQNQQMHLPKLANAFAKIGKAIPNIYTDNIDNIDIDNISHNIINDIIQDNNQKKENTKRKKSELDLSFVSVHFRDVFEQWLAYHKELGCPYKQTGAVAAYNKLLKLSDNDPSIAQKIVEQSMSNNWRGLFSLRKEEYGTRSSNNNWATEFCKNVEQWAGVYK